jgi:hypothetical protein
LLPVEVFPRLAGDGLDDFAGDEIQHVVVRVGAAKAGGRLNEAQASRDFLAIVG